MGAGASVGAMSGANVDDLMAELSVEQLQQIQAALADAIGCDVEVMEVFNEVFPETQLRKEPSDDSEFAQIAIQQHELVFIVKRAGEFAFVHHPCIDPKSGGGWIRQRNLRGCTSIVCDVHNCRFSTTKLRARPADDSKWTSPPIELDQFELVYVVESRDGFARVRLPTAGHDETGWIREQHLRLVLNPRKSPDSQSDDPVSKPSRQIRSLPRNVAAGNHAAPRTPLSPARNSRSPPATQAARSVSQLPAKKPEWLLPGGLPYTPNPKSVLVIAAGAPWVWDAIPQPGATEVPARCCHEVLWEAGYDVTVIYERTYDRYPVGWDRGRPDLTSNGGKNHTTLADDFVVPKLKELVDAGRGPAVIVAGSRGGQCTLPRLWELGWRGGAVCVNAGCVLGKLPQSCRLSLVTGGHDFFKQSANPELAQRQMRREDANVPMLLFHDPKMGHTGSPDDFERAGHHMLTREVLTHLIDLTSLDFESWRGHRIGTTVGGPWPTNAYLKVV